MQLDKHILIPPQCDGLKCNDISRLVPTEIYGSGNTLVGIVGEAPYKDEVALRRPFIGRAGRILRSYMNTRDFRYVIANSVQCMPSTKDHKPTKEMIDTCRPILMEILDILPEDSVVMSLGTYAQLALFGKRVVISTEPYRLEFGNKTFNVYVNYHPMAMVYRPILRGDFESILRASGCFTC